MPRMRLCGLGRQEKAAPHTETRGVEVAMYELKKIADYSIANPHLSQHQVAAHFDCGQSTVSAARRKHGLYTGRVGRRPNRLLPGQPPSPKFRPVDPVAAYAVAEAKRQLAARHQGPWCEHVSYYKEYCCNEAAHTEIGPRCRWHAPGSKHFAAAQGIPYPRTK